MKIVLSLYLLFSCLSSFAQADTTNLQYHQINDELQYGYSKPRFFDLFVNIPKNYVDMGKGIATKDGLKLLGITAISTAILLPSDQFLLNNAQDASEKIGLSSSHRYKKLVGGMDFPTNLSAMYYHFGHGNTSLLFATGFLATGLIKKDYRAVHTSIEIGESILTLGVLTQGLKRVFGRQSPNRSVVDGGNWHFFPNLKEYMKNTSNYDAMPSGHMATLTATFTVIARNYPEVKWIKPIGYTMIGLMGFEMMNSGVHWAGDYPLGILIGYAVGTVSANRRITKVENKKYSFYKTRYKPELTVTNFLGQPMLGARLVF
jgi:membrane-associated phospholipid phosphatase